MEQLLPKNAIFLDKYLKIKYSTVSLGSDSTYLNLNWAGKNFQPMCFHCGDRNIIKQGISGSFSDYYWYHCGNYKHFFCPSCYAYAHCSDDQKPFEGRCSKSDYSVFQDIKFECKWPACKKMFGCSTLKKHEISCTVQPKRKCPVQGCRWCGRLDELESEHFETHENSMLIYGNEVTDLIPGTDFYLLILGKFVLVRYAMEELGEVFLHDFSLKMCKLLLSFAKPVGLVTTRNTILLKQIEGFASVKTIQKQVDLFVYFKNV